MRGDKEMTESEKGASAPSPTSEDIEALAKRLETAPRAHHLTEAAAALRRMVGERDEAREAWRNESRAATLWTARATAAEAERDRLRSAATLLEKLTAMVRGECPSLLNEDSGGDGELSLQIDEFFARAALALIGESAT